MPPSAQLGGGFEERDFAESHTIPEFPRACLKPEIARRDANIVLHYTYNRQSTRVAAFVCLHTSWAIGNADKSTGWSGEGYEGWNEVCFDAGIDYRDNRDKLEALVVVLPTGYGSFSDQAGHFGSSWPGGGERPPIRYEDSWGDLGGPLDTQLLIYSYKKR